ncbi:MAG TPA: nickel-dependent hydrogenase large subunit [Geobacteraceae bacterium]|nr:nickel-dependent hydrogenase large subunit [Geobacteraceae bacterium]
MAKTVLPFGPQHPVLPEPLHLTLAIEDEIVKEAIPKLGYVHRGLEKLAEIRDHNQMIYIVERVCGICSCMHALCYCQGIEALMGLDVPARAKYLRTIWAEMHRIHSHLLWLGLFADAFGFESLFMQFWRIRERVMDLQEETAGNRVILSVNQVGGVRRDITAESAQWILDTLKLVEKETLQLKSTILDDATVKLRTVGKGVLTKEKAYELGAAGPTLRASGIAQDIRQTGYAAYSELDFAPVVETDGDCYARTVVRFKEIFQAIDLLRQAFAKLPEGELAVKPKGLPTGEVVSRVEQPRGEVLYYLRGSGKKFLERVRIRTPTFANIPPLLDMLPGCDLADVPVLILTIDPCISCTER